MDRIVLFFDLRLRFFDYSRRNSKLLSINCDHYIIRVFVICDIASLLFQKQFINVMMRRDISSQKFRTHIHYVSERERRMGSSIFGEGGRGAGVKSRLGEGG